jgi:two-component system, sensor histidine kinase
MQTFELGKFLNKSLAKHKEYAQQKNIDLTIVTDFASYITLKGDKIKIRSLLGNIIKNTIDNSGATSVVFSVRPLVKSGKEILLEFSLEDDGSILHSSKKIAYFRSLVANKTLIEELNGKSEFINSPEGGSILKFIIGCALAGTSENYSHDNGLSLLKGKKVLIVDDNEINRVTIAQFLQNKGIECTMASDGIKAIQLLEHNNVYDLILLDILMPQMDGFETATYIRKKLKNHTHIIAMPARDKVWIPLLCKEAGIDKIIKKPFEPNDLLKLINSTLFPVIHTTSALLKKIA